MISQTVIEIHNLVDQPLGVPQYIVTPTVGQVLPPIKQEHLMSW
mgnify:FL=1